MSDPTRTVAIDAYAKALDDVFLFGGVAGALGFFFALLCRDIKFVVFLLPHLWKVTDEKIVVSKGRSLLNSLEEEFV